MPLTTVAYADAACVCYAPTVDFLGIIFHCCATCMLTASSQSDNKYSAHYPTYDESKMGAVLFSG